HRVHERADLAPRPRSTGTSAQVDRPVNQPLKAKPVDQGTRQHHPRIGNQALVVELDPHRIGPHGHPEILHHASDLLTQAAAALYSRLLPPQEFTFASASDVSDPSTVDRGLKGDPRRTFQRLLLNVLVFGPAVARRERRLRSSGRRSIVVPMRRTPKTPA